MLYITCTHKKKHITLDTLLAEIKLRSIVDIGRTSLWYLLRNIGFKYAKDDNRRALCEKSHVVEMRTHFLRQYTKMSSALMQPGQFVFLDETWIFSRGGSKRSWQDNSVKSVKNSGGEGKRYIVLHAGNEHGFINGASLIFSSKSKSADYHDSMNADMFTKWLKEKLLPNLKQKSVIVLDNASYHSAVLNQQPTFSWKKENIKNWLMEQNISFPENSLKSDLYKLAVSNKRPKEFAVDKIIREHGHEVLRLPPYHCQFNPIELVWGIAKTYYDNHIGENGYADKEVLDMWQKSLNTVTAETWKNSIKHTNSLINEWWEREKIINEVNPIIITLNAGSDSESEDWWDQ